MKHILVAYDVSKQAEKAFNFAIDIADKYHAELTVLIVTPSVKMSENTGMKDTIKSSRNFYINSLKPLQKKAKQRYPSVRIHYKIIDGVPAEEIVKNVEALGIDHIVMGHRGLSKFKRWLLGSVAKQVMIYASCTITIVR